MVIARNKGINALLCQQFSQRTVDKVYTALLCGHLAEDEGIVEAATPKIRPVSRMALCARHGKPARSRYRVIDRLYQAREGERALALTRVTLTPETDGPISCVFTASCWAIRSWLRSVRWPGAARHGTGSAADAARQRTALCPPRQP